MNFPLSNIISGGEIIVGVRLFRSDSQAWSLHSSVTPELIELLLHEPLKYEQLNLTEMKRMLVEREAAQASATSLMTSLMA